MQKMKVGKMDNLKEIKKAIQKIEKMLDKVGIVGKAREKFLLGEEIIKCPYCRTYNCYSEYYSKKDDWERFKCANCGQNHIKIYE